MKRPRLPLLLLFGVLAWCWPRFKVLPDARATQPQSAAVASGSRPLAHADIPATGFLPRAGNAAHAVTLVELDNGRIMAAWFTGSREGASDVAISSSILDRGVWSTPLQIVDRRIVQRDTQRLIRKLGNPLLWRDARNVLHLWFVSVSYGGWAGSAINHMQSSDEGRHWSRATRIVSSPFWNLSTLVRNPPLGLVDGGFFLPVYHEFINKRSELLRFDRGGHVVDKARIPGSNGTLQPAVVALDQDRLFALMRSSNATQRIQSSRSKDGGTHWLPSTTTDIPNPDSAVAMIRLADGSLLLACNPLRANRNQLALMRSLDEGKRWSPPYLVEQGSENDEFSYPALLQGSSGTVHLAYTWKRQAIKHISLPKHIIEGLR